MTKRIGKQAEAGLSDRYRTNHQARLVLRCDSRIVSETVLGRGKK